MLNQHCSFFTFVVVIFFVSLKLNIVVYTIIVAVRETGLPIDQTVVNL